jgi:hypothetical protein
MGIIASVLGGIGGLCAVIGIVTALEVMPDIGAQFTWMFWFVLSAILLLGAIAIAVGRGGGYE